MSLKPIIFYDLKRNVSNESDYNWSPNTWRSRLVLNIKGLPYETVWLNITDVEPTMKKLGLQPRPAGSHLAYAVPTIYDPNTKKLVNDSVTIAEYLEATYPDAQKLIPSHTAALQRAVINTNSVMLRLTFPMLMNNILRAAFDEDKEYFRTSRERMFRGVKLEDAEPKGEELAGMIQLLEKHFDDLGRCIDANGDGAIFFGGSAPYFVDVDIAAHIIFWNKVSSPDHPLVKSIASANGGRWIKYLAAFSEWTERTT